MICCNTKRHARQLWLIARMRRTSIFVICFFVVACLTAASAVADKPIRLTHDGKRKLSPVFMPGGDSIAFTVHHVPNQVIVKRLNLTDGSQEPLFPADPAHQFDAAFSRDGRYRSYCRSASIRQLVLVIQDTRDNNKEFIFLPPGSSRGTVRSLKFTPDGRRIVFTLSAAGGLQIASVNLKGEDLKRLTESEGTNYWPSISPDGKSIAFSSSRNGPYDIYVMDIDGGNVRRLTNSPTRDIRPAWSPDGKQIAFTSARDGNYELYVMNADGIHPRRVTNHPERDDFAAWQPDGKKLLTVAERDGRMDLYLIDVPE